MRRGVQFGPELTLAENISGKTLHGRGLLFTCYQSSISNGFQFLQHCESFFFVLFGNSFFDPIWNALAWANATNFPPFSGQPLPGYVIKVCSPICFIHNNDRLDSSDPLIGQDPVRSMIGLSPLDATGSTTLPTFIIPKGGEYFFAPGISGLKNTIAKA